MCVCGGVCHVCVYECGGVYHVCEWRGVLHASVDQGINAILIETALVQVQELSINISELIMHLTFQCVNKFMLTNLLSSYNQDYICVLFSFYLPMRKDDCYVYVQEQQHLFFCYKIGSNCKYR